jgi:nicotinamidase-related amidase
VNGYLCHHLPRSLSGKDSDDEILNAVRPGLATTGGPLFMISSPYARRGELWRVFQKHYGGAGDPLHHPWRNSDDRANIVHQRSWAPNDNTTMAKRIVPDHCCGVIIDVQAFFLSQADECLRSKIKTNTKNFARLLGYFGVPIVVTLERPVDQKGSLPKEISKHLSDLAEAFEKDFFDLTKEKKIRDYLGRLKKKQVIVAGCETDVCVLQSCLGLLGLGYEVYVVEELLFSSSQNVDSAITRMKAEGAVFLTYKSLYYELVEAVEGNRHAEKILKKFGPLPGDLPDSAVQ